VQYRINTATVLTQDDMEHEDIIREFTNPPDWWQPGFVDFIVFRPNETDGTCSITNCRFIDNPSGPTGDECCNYTYIAYPVNNEWHIKTWSWWGDHCPPLFKY
ncbi:hypothetical protein V5T82_11635, partial [Magnetovibrio sp. PR-2]|uniref:hypothetical protein n=1 Tax=Magnetovibrio sp. PR-2 TaxID=3120356 RepID=UPI002FCE0A44